MNYSKFNITFPGQKVTICNRLIKKFRDEHNNHGLGQDFRTARSALDAVIPQYFDKRAVWLKTYIGQVLPTIPGADRTKALEVINFAYDRYITFASYQKREYKATIKRLQRDRNDAVLECENDNFHNPSWNDFQSNGLPSKNPNKNPSTNYGYLIRLKKLSNLTDVQIEEVESQIKQTEKEMELDSFFDADINLDNYRRTINTPLPPDPFVDWTTWTEVDSAGDITVTSNLITVDTMRRDAVSYVHTNKSLTGDFEHLIDCKSTLMQNNCWCSIWCAANVIDTAKGLIDASENSLFVIFFRTSAGSDYRIQIREQDGATSYTDFYQVLSAAFLNVDYYLTIARDETVGSFGQFTCDIYSDVDRTTGIDNLALSLHTSLKDYSKLMVAQSFGDLTVPAISCTLSNLDFQEVTLGLGQLVNGGLVNNSLTRERLVS